MPSARFHWYTRCRRCRRALKAPESIAAGFGPHCLHLVEITASEAQQIEQLMLLPGLSIAHPPGSPRFLSWARFWLVPDEVPDE